MKVVYVVSIPLDRYKVSESRVFQSLKDAEQFCVYFNEVGYNGGAIGGLKVETVLIKLSQDFEHIRDEV